MTLSEAQENYEKRIASKNGKSKWFGFVETRRKMELPTYHNVSRKKSSRGKTMMLAGGLKMFGEVR